MNNTIFELRTLFDTNSIAYRADEPLKNHSTFHIGGPAKLFVMPNDTMSFVKTMRIIQESGVRYIVIGNGSNILFADEGFDGVVVSTVGMKNITVDGCTVTSDCGTQCAMIALAAQHASLTGLEFVYGIPGTCGGGVFMNGGAYGGQMSDVLRSVTYYDTKSGNTIDSGTGELDFSYRHSLFMEHPEYVILSSKFELTAGNSDAIMSTMNENMRLRREKQPLEYPSAGSVFKRHEGYYIGRVIEECGLKGFTVGGAQVSRKHAGFIVNIGGATADDVLQVISHIKKTVAEKYGFEPECEIRYIV